MRSFLGGFFFRREVARFLRRSGRDCGRGGLFSYLFNFLTGVFGEFIRYRVRFFYIISFRCKIIIFRGERYFFRLLIFVLFVFNVLKLFRFDV